MNYARNRDENELEIVKALEAAGATVQRLNETGTPDLLVGFRGETHLIEVKRIGKRGGVKHGHHGADDRGLARTQQKWWAEWNGKQPVIVYTAEEALAVIGAS